MSKTYRPRSAHRGRRNLSRLKQDDRSGLIESLSRYRQTLAEREERTRIERLWEQSIDFFADRK